MSIAFILLYLIIFMKDCSCVVYVVQEFNVIRISFDTRQINLDEIVDRSV